MGKKDLPVLLGIKFIVCVRLLYWKQRDGYLKSAIQPEIKLVRASARRFVQKLKSFTFKVYSLVAESSRTNRSFVEGNNKDQTNYVRYRYSLLV